MVPDRPLALRRLSPSVRRGPGPEGPLARSPSKVRISSMGRRTSLCAVPLLPFLPRGCPDRVRVSENVPCTRPTVAPSIARCRRRATPPVSRRSEVPPAPFVASSKRPTTGGWCVRARSRPERCFFRSRRSLRWIGVASELAALPSETWRVPRSPVARCAGAVRVGWVDLPSFHVRSRHPFGLRSPPVGCRDVVPVSLVRTQREVAFPTGPDDLRVRGSLHVTSSETGSPAPSASLAGGRVRRSHLPPSDVSRAGSTSASVVPARRTSSRDVHRPASRSTRVLDGFSGPWPTLRTSTP